jgi:hypothetical protein
MTKFAKTFDLGNVAEDEDARPVESSPYIDTTVLNLPTRQGMTGSAIYNSNMIMLNTSGPPVTTAPRPGFPQDQASRGDGSTPTTIGGAFPGLLDNSRHSGGGDFAGDLMPSGFPHFGMPGNVMGPNHPHFFNGVTPPPPGLGMLPRFDPFGPPGGPTDPTGIPEGQHKNRLSRGDPNPDHLRPPNNLNNNNLFM